MSNVKGESEMIPTESKTTRTVGNFSHGSRETPVTSAAPMAADRSEKARGHKSDAHVTVFSRHSGVRQFHSTEEVGEQSQRAADGGVDGGKGTDQGEC